MSGFEATREQVRACLGHLMWGTISVDAEFVECSCGWRWETVFDDDCAITDIEFHGGHRRFVIAYPETDDTYGGMRVMLDGDEFELASGDLAWLLARPDVPEPFRRAAAVHLNK